MSWSYTHNYGVWISRSPGEQDSLQTGKQNTVGIRRQPHFCHILLINCQKLKNKF